LLLGIALFLFLIFTVNLRHFTYNMNADIAADVILSKLMGDASRITVPPTWISSSELKLIALPNIAALIQMLLDDANLAFGWACCLMTLGIAISIYAFMGQLGFDKPNKLLMVFLSLALPTVLSTLTMLYLPAAYCSIHVIAFFISLAFYHAVLDKKIKLPLYVLSSILALLLGIQGLRGLLLIYAPLFTVELLRNITILWQKKSLKKANVIALCHVGSLCVFSYVGTLLPMSIGYPTGRNMRRGFNDLIYSVLPDLARSLGSNTFLSHPVALGALTLLGLSTIIYVLSLLISLLKKRGLSNVEWTYLVLPVSLIISLIMTAFTTTSSSSRYFFMSVFVLAMSTVMILGKANSGICRLIHPFLLASVIILAFANVSLVYLPILRSERPPQSDMQKVADYLLSQDYAIAYSPFDYAGVFSVLADNQIIVAAVADPGTLEINRWLNSWEFFPPYRPYEEKTAYIFSDNNNDNDVFLGFVATNGHADIVFLDMQIGSYYIYSSPYNLTSAVP